MRIWMKEGKTVIAKIRKVQNLKERLKRMCGVSDPCCEFRIHRHVAEAGLLVPRPIMLFNMTVSCCGDFEVIVMEDLGPTTNGVVFLKDLINSAKEEAVNEFEEKVIELTRLIVRAKILDLDHQLKNIVVNETGQVVRIDLECARRRNFVGLPAKEYGAMLSRLVCSHVYACQPEAQRSERFAADLVAALRPPENVLQHAGRGVRENLERQRQRKGIDSQLRLTW